MADPILRQELELTPLPEPRIPLVPSGDELALDQAYQAREARRDEERWGQLMQEGAAMGQAGQDKPATSEKPSAIAKAGEAGLQAAGEGAQQFMQGLTRFVLSGEAAPEDQGRGIATEVASGLAGKAVAAKDMVMGLMGVLSSPGAAAGAGVEQALKNAGLDAAMRIPGGIGGLAPLLRAAAGGDIEDTAPMNLGELANLVTAAATPAIAGRVKKGLPGAARELKGERGSIGGRPPTQGFTEGPQDPSWLARFVRDQGGVAPSRTADLSGEYQRIPQRFKRPGGFSPDRMAEAIQEVTGQAYSDAQLLADLEGVDRKRARVRGQETGFAEGYSGMDEPPRAAETAGEPAPGPVPEQVRVNLARIEATESVKNTIANINALNSERLAESRKTKTHEQTIAGSRGAMSVEDVLAIPEGYPLNEEQITAVRDIRDAAAAHVDDLMKRVLNGEADTGLIEAFLVAGEIEAKRETSVRTAARVLEAQKIGSNAQRAAFDMGRLAEIAASLRDVTTDGIDEHVLANRLAALRTPNKRPSYIGTVGRYAWTGYQNVLDLLHWAFINSLLSNPVTHAANVAGTLGLTAWHLPERFIAGAINDLVFRNPEGVHVVEAWAAARGMAEGVFTDSVRMMGRALEGEAIFGRNPVEAHFDIKARTFGLDPETPAGKVVEVVGMMQPTRLMGVEDAFAKGVNYRGEIKALATREAWAEGLRGDARSERAAQLEAAPSPSILAAAQDASMLRTLNAELGPAGRAVMMAANMTPGARFVAPFIRTPTNIGKAVWQRAPVLNLLSKQNWSDLMAGGARANMAGARIALGSAVGGAVAWQVAQGNITGAGPSNRNLQRDLREDGLPQYSIRVGDEWYGYNRLDPVGMYLGAIATAMESASQVPDPESHWTEVAFAATAAAGKSMLDKTWAQGVKGVLDAIQEPDRKAKAIGMGWARAIVPAGVRQVTRTGIPGVVEAHPEIRELRDFTDAIYSGLPDLTPGAAKFGIEYDLPSVVDVPPRLHPITGDPMTYPAGWGPDLISPIYVSRRKNDPVLDELVGNEVVITNIPNAIFGSSTEQEMLLRPPKASDKVKLSKDEYYRLQVLATKGGDAGEHNGVDLGPLRGLPSLYDRLLVLINSDAYKAGLTAGPEGSRSDAIKQVVNTYREAARLQIRREYPLLDQVIRDREELRLRMKVPPDRQPGPLPSTGPASLNYLTNTLGR